MVGGAAVTEEIAPGHRCPTLAHSIGPLRPSIVADMQLARAGRVPAARPAAGGAVARRAALVLSTDVARSAESIRRHAADGCRPLSRVLRDARAAGRLHAAAAGANAAVAGRPGRRERSGTCSRPGGGSESSVAATGSACCDGCRWRSRIWSASGSRAICSRRRSPRAASLAPPQDRGPAGTGAALLWNAAIDPVPGGSTIVVKGGPGALTAALADAARGAGADDPRSMRVSPACWSATARPPASCSTDGEEVPAARGHFERGSATDAARAGRSRSSSIRDSFSGFATTACPAPWRR